MNYSLSDAHRGFSLLSKTFVLTVNVAIISLPFRVVHDCCCYVKYASAKVLIKTVFRVCVYVCVCVCACARARVCLCVYLFKK